ISRVTCANKRVALSCNPRNVRTHPARPQREFLCRAPPDGAASPRPTALLADIIEGDEPAENEVGNILRRFSQGHHHLRSQSVCADRVRSDDESKRLCHYGTPIRSKRYGSPEFRIVAQV